MKCLGKKIRMEVEEEKNLGGLNMKKLLERKKANRK